MNTVKLLFGSTAITPIRLVLIIFILYILKAIPTFQWDYVLYFSKKLKTTQRNKMCKKFKKIHLIQSNNNPNHAD